MPITIEPRPQERILLTTYDQPFDADIDVGQAVVAINEFAPKVEGAFFVLVDLRRVDLPFGGLVMALGTLRHLPDGVHFVIIGSGDMVTLAAEAAKQKQYGEYRIPVFATPEEALNHVANERKRLGV
jgi:hypothetical protein